MNVNDEVKSLEAPAKISTDVVKTNDMESELVEESVFKIALAPNAAKTDLKVKLLKLIKHMITSSDQDPTTLQMIHHELVYYKGNLLVLFSMAILFS